GRRSQRVDARARGSDKGRGRGPGGRTHLRQCRDQEGAVPRGRQRPRLAAQGAPVVGARLSLPRAHALPGRQPGMPQPAAAAGKRGLRLGAELVVQRRRAAPEAVAAGRAPRADDERTAAGMPAGARRAVSYTNIPTPTIAVIIAPSTMATMMAQM